MDEKGKFAKSISTQIGDHDDFNDAIYREPKKSKYEILVENYCDYITQEQKETGKTKSYLEVCEHLDKIARMKDNEEVIELNRRNKDLIDEELLIKEEDLDTDNYVDVDSWLKWKKKEEEKQEESK